MFRRRFALGLLAPISLLLLVVALGALQYRWVGQVSEAEREQLKESLDRRSREFADDFDREIGRAHQTFRPPTEFMPSAPDRFARLFDEWQTSARFPAMLKTAYFAVQDGNRMVLHQYKAETRSFHVIEWPEHLKSIEHRLTTTVAMQSAQGGAPKSGTAYLVSTMPVVPEIPALVIADTPPMPGKTTPFEALHMPGVSATFLFDVKTSRKFTILELDRDVLSSTVLPSLAGVHFPESGVDRFRLAIVDGASRMMFSRGLPSGQTLDSANADATIGFFGIRIESVRNVVAQLRGNSSPSTVYFSTRSPEAKGTIARGLGEPTDRLSMVVEQHAASIAGTTTRGASRAGWTLLLQHGAGSLDAAVERARQRNLWLSFGILGVLATSVGLVMVNARRSERLAAQQLDFVASVSHELRTPVAVIRSAAQNLAAGVVNEPAQAKQYGTLIEAEGRRLTDMVEQVLEFAGLSDGKRAIVSRPVDAGQLVRDVVSTSESLPEAARVTFETTIDDSLPAIMVEEDAIRRALLNLVGNAVKYGADGGWVGVTVARGSGRDDGHLSISVADRGRGIPAEDLPQIFKPFYRGSYARDRQIHGNGLGLSLVKRIVDAHGGRIDVKSAPNAGTTFTLLLPIASGAAAEAEVRATSQPDPQGHSA